MFLQTRHFFHKNGINNQSWWCRIWFITNEPQHGKTNKVTVCPAKTQISLCICPVWSESSLSAWRKLGSYPLSAQWRLWSDWADAQADLSLHWAHSHFVGFVMSWLKCSMSHNQFWLLAKDNIWHRIWIMVIDYLTCIWGWLTSIRTLGCFWMADLLAFWPVTGMLLRCRAAEILWRIFSVVSSGPLPKYKT